MKNRKPFYLSSLMTSAAIVAVLAPNSWALEEVSMAPGKQQAAELATVENLPADLSVPNEQIFEEGSELSELARLSDLEMRETQGAFRNYMFEPGGWRYWDVRLEHNFRNLPPGGCLVGDVCFRIGGWHLWRAAQQ
ncbi:MAG: hypothetical protein Q4B17_09545 [Lautropia sp.]|nr:hypothetical protein [Lautropia sp.]